MIQFEIFVLVPALCAARPGYALRAASLHLSRAAGCQSLLLMKQSSVGNHTAFFELDIQKPLILNGENALAHLGLDFGQISTDQWKYPDCPPYLALNRIGTVHDPVIRPGFEDLAGLAGGIAHENLPDVECRRECSYRDYKGPKPEARFFRVFRVFRCFRIMFSSNFGNIPF